MDGSRRNRLRRSAVALAVVGLLVVTTGCDPAGAVEDWPTFGHDAGHSGTSGETTIKVGNAASLGIKWQVNTGDAVYSSPVVAFNAQLGKRLVYVANNSGVMNAYDAANGRRVWFKQIGPRVNSTATVLNGVVYVGSADKKLYALDGATGAVKCTTAATGGVIASSPVAVNVPGQGVVVYFGDNGLSGSDDGGHVWAVNGVDANAAANCSTKWSFDDYANTNSGTWSPIAYGKGSDNVPVVVFGGSSPDDAVYAVNAVTGLRKWRFQANPDGKFDADVGAGATISPPSATFPGGVVYVSGKENATYAINLTTGSQTPIWRFDMVADSPGLESYARSTAALVKNLLFLGYGSGLYQLNAVDGTRLKKSPQTAEIISSPALSGPEGARVVIAGDITGNIRVFNAGTLAIMKTIPTGGQIYSSPAVSTGAFFIGSTDGFLYAVAPGGATGSPPNTTITTPADGSTVQNPGGSLQVRGKATDNTAVSQVLYSVRDDNARKWWNAASGSWVTVFAQNTATVASPGAASTNWSAAFPVKPDGGSFTVLAEAVDNSGMHDPTPDGNSVFAEATGDSPNTVLTAPGNDQVITFPDGHRQTFDVVIRGTSSDPGGSNRGVTKVMVAVQNLEHGEYFCKLPTCNPFGSFPWTTSFNAQPATLASPGANSTTWSLSVTMYDHPHSYLVTAWAIDGNGHTEQSRPVRTFCVRDSAGQSCGGGAAPASAGTVEPHVCTLQRKL